MEEVALQRLIALKKLLTCLKRDVFSVRSVPSKQAEVVGKWKKLTTSSTALSYILESMQQPSLTKNAFSGKIKHNPRRVVFHVIFLCFRGWNCCFSPLFPCIYGSCSISKFSKALKSTSTI